MSQSLKIILGLLALATLALLISQVTLGQLIVNGYSGPHNLRKIHQHSGYLTVGTAILYVLTSSVAILRIPARPNTGSVAPPREI